MMQLRESSGGVIGSKVKKVQALLVPRIGVKQMLLEDLSRPNPAFSASFLSCVEAIAL
jgi:hypothetical protein